MKNTIKTFPYFSSLVWIFKKTFWLLFVVVKFIGFVFLELLNSMETDDGEDFRRSLKNRADEASDSPIIMGSINKRDDVC